MQSLYLRLSCDTESRSIKIKLELKGSRRSCSPKSRPKMGTWSTGPRASRVRQTSKSVRLERCAPQHKSLWTSTFRPEPQGQVAGCRDGNQPNLVAPGSARRYTSLLSRLFSRLLTDSPEAALAGARSASLNSRAICAEGQYRIDRRVGTTRACARPRGAGIDQLQKSRSVGSQRQLARVGDLRWSSVKEHLAARGQGARKESILSTR